MKLEHLQLDFPLLRLYDFDAGEARLLLERVLELASGATTRLAVHELPFVESVGDCRLTFIVDVRDQSLSCTAAPGALECRLTAGTWDNVAGLIELFAGTPRGFQWLRGSADEGGLLLSVSGQW